MPDSMTTSGVSLTLAFQDTPLPTTAPMGSDQAATSEGASGDGSGAGGAGGTQQQPGIFSPFMLLIVLLMVFMIFSTVMTGRKEKKRMAEMLGALKRGDRVLTSAGMYGTVHEVKPDAVVLRIDEVSGTKAQFSKNAVQQVVKSGKGDSKSDETEEEALAKAD